MNEAPAEVLKEARQKILAMMDLGLSRDTLFNLVATSNPTTATDKSQNTSQQQQQQPSQQSQQQQPLPARPVDGLIQDVKQENQPTRPIDNGVSNAPAPSNVFWPKPGPYHHRPRISVSSTSSGSSGRASIWSNTGSFASTSSGATHYSQSSPLSQSQSLQSAQSGTTSPPGVQNPAGWPTGRLNFYWCTSCETRFKRKYDWKRHEEEFHERWKKYPCPEPGCNRSFWGANTFNQHHKSSHGCKTCPHSEQVVKYLRKRKYWACGFCAALHPSRERHVEHVARHFEAGKTKADWTHSRVIYGLLHQPLIHEAWKDILNEKQGEFAGRQA